MINYFLVFSWGILLLLSFIGWGNIINKILFHKYRVDWGQRAAWGVAWAIAVGGLLNLTWSISRVTILLFLVSGLVYWIFDFWQHRKSFIKSLLSYFKSALNNRLVFLGWSLIFVIIFIQYGSLLFSYQFHPHDDYQAYFVFPKKMIELGSMGADPFSERRLLSSLGGQYFLHTFILSFLSEENLRIIDPGIAFIIFWGLTLGLLKEEKINRKIQLLILIPLLLIPAPTSNITSLVMGTALFFSLFRFLFWDRIQVNNFLANSFIIALISTAIVASKSSLIPPVVIFLISSYLFYFIRSSNKKKIVTEIVIFIVLAIILLLPWMISMYQSSGTLLYPLLGKGYHISVYDKNYILPTNDLFTINGLLNILLSLSNVYFICFLLVVAFYFQFKPWQSSHDNRRVALLSLIISSVFGVVITVLVTGGYSKSLRYYFPYVLTTIIVLTITSISQIKLEKKLTDSKLIPVLVSMLVLGMLVGGGNSWQGILSSYKGKLLSIKVGIVNSSSITSPEEIDTYTKIQQSIPKGEIIFSRLNKPFLFDFRKNTIFIIDAPAASLPPGMPFFKGSDLLAEYLTSKSIRYVAYDYEKPPTVDKRYWEEKLKEEGVKIHPWVRNHARYTIDLHNNLENLGKTRKKIYDDGQVFVIDLMTKL
jgi:hypothetical protein